LVNLPILASWLLFHFATKTEHLYAALCLSGLGGGLMEAPVGSNVCRRNYGTKISASYQRLIHVRYYRRFHTVYIGFIDGLADNSSYFGKQSSHNGCEGGFLQHIEEEFNRLYDELITQPVLEERTEEAYYDSITVNNTKTTSGFDLEESTETEEQISTTERADDEVRTTTSSTTTTTTIVKDQPSSKAKDVLSSA
ncbi:hypothetical protein EVAR_73678_1, partial [Eumeta japonica]